MNNRRTAVLATFVLFGFVLVGFRLGHLMLLSHKELSEEARLQHQIRKELGVNRGLILDRRGRPLAVNLDTLSVYGNPSEIENPSVTAAALARATGIPQDAVVRKVSDTRGFVWVKRKLDTQAAERLRNLRLKGVGFIPEAKRFYPKGEVASQVLGFVGLDNQALEGVELKYDSDLKGERKVVMVGKDAAGRTLSDGAFELPKGNTVVLTLDEGIQYIAEQALDKAISSWGCAGAIAILMDPFSGEILAMANRPGCDLNGLGSCKPAWRRNRAITDTFEPGSTFKIVTAAAAIEEGVVKPTEVFDVSLGYIDVGRKRIFDVHRAKRLTFAEVIKTSSNVGTIKAGARLQTGVLHAYAVKLGFGEQTGIDLPGEVPGALKPPRQWSGTSQAAISIGYEVSATPLQVLRAYAAVANGGWLVSPHILKEVQSPEGATIMRQEAKLGAQVLSPHTARTLKEILTSVTGEGGTASSANVDGNSVAGKTGTTKMLDRSTKTYSSERYISSFVGFVPAQNPRFVLSVLVFEPKGEYYGGQVAAPVFREIASQALAYLDVPRDDTFENNVLLVRKAERP